MRILSCCLFLLIGLISLLPTPTQAQTAEPSTVLTDTVTVTLDPAINLEAYEPSTPFVLHFNYPMRPWQIFQPLVTFKQDDKTVSVKTTAEWDKTGTALTVTLKDNVLPSQDYMLHLNVPLMTRNGLKFTTPMHWKFRTAIGTQMMSSNTGIILDNPAPPPLPTGATVTQPNSIAVYRYESPIILYTLRPTLQFSFTRPMNEMMVNKAIRFSPGLSFKTTWQSNTVTISPTEAMLPDTYYKFFISYDEAKDINGWSLQNTNDQWLYTAPLLAYSQFPNTTNPQGPIVFYFNYAMKFSKLKPTFNIEPAMTGEFSWNDAQNVITFTPSAPFAYDTTYKVTFNDHLYTLQEDKVSKPFAAMFGFSEVTFSQHGKNIHPATKLTFNFSQPMDKATTVTALNITPTTSFETGWQDNNLIITPTNYHWPENTLYTVTLSASARTLANQPLAHGAYTWQFNTSSYTNATSFGVGVQLQLVDSEGRRALQFASLQADPLWVEFTLQHLTSSNLILRLIRVVDYQNEDDSDSLPVNQPQTITTPIISRWLMETTPLTHPYLGLKTDYSLPDDNFLNTQEAIIPADVPAGIYVLTMRSGDNEQRLVVVLSQNTLVVKRAKGQLMTWVSNINGAVVANSKVTLYNAQGEPLVEGVTNSNGAFYAKGLTSTEVVLAVAQQGDDITISGVTDSWNSGSDWYSGWWQTPYDSYEYTRMQYDHAVNIYTDRPIYRPGQTVNFKAIVRQDDDAILDLLPLNTPIKVELRRDEATLIRTFELPLNRFSTANGTFTLADNAPLGDYILRVTLAGQIFQQQFKVQDYRKPNYEVMIKTNQPDYLNNDTIEISVTVSYLSGEPIPNAEVKLNQYYIGYAYSWYAGLTTESWNPENEPIIGHTDAQGQFTATMLAEYHPDENNYWWWYPVKHSQMAVEAVVDDGSHNTVSNSSGYYVYKHNEQLTLSVGNYFHKPNEPISLEGLAQTIHHEPLINQPLNVTVHTWNNKVVYSTVLTTNEQGQVKHTFAINQSDFYYVDLSMVNEQGEKITTQDYLYIFNDDYGWFTQKDETLTIIADQKSYKPNDVAHLLVQSAFDGPALLTVERGKTRREIMVQLTAPATKIDLPLQIDDVPNIYVTLSAWEAQDTTTHDTDRYTKPDSRLHRTSLELSVPATHKKLNVTITPDKAIYRPREEANFTLRVTNQQGEPVSAEVSLAMVDEAIFLLSSDLSKPLYNSFYYDRDHMIITFDSMVIKRDLLRYLYGGYGGGGGGPDYPAARFDFPDTAAWFPVLYTDGNGEVTVKVTMPDSLTSWRLTAKAVTADTQIGEISHNVLTQQEVVLRPSLPRGLTAGDNAVLSTVISNNSDLTQTLTISLTEWLTPLLNITSPLTQTVELKPHESQVVGWAVQARQAGTTELLITAVAGEQQVDAIRLPMPIRPLAVPEVKTQIGQFTQRYETTLTLPNNTLPMTSVQMEFSPSIAGSLLNGLEYLTGYPYGCVEQTMSRALPNAVVSRAFKQLGVPSDTLELDSKIEASLDRLYMFQHEDGGWGWWTTDESHDYQTAWVVFGLQVMADGGHAVNREAISRGVMWLNENMGKMDERTQAYALYSMAMADSPNITKTLLLAQKYQSLDTFSQAALALALDKMGQVEQSQTIVDYLAEQATIDNDGMVYWPASREDGHYYHKTMASSIRSTALALSAFIKIRPHHALEAGIVDWLMSQRKQEGWGSTNETSYAIIGLTDYLLSRQSLDSNKSTSYTMWLNDTVIKTGNLGVGNLVVKLELPVTQLQTGTNTLRVETNGQDPMYYLINQRTYVAEANIQAAGNISLIRRYLNPQTNQPITQTQVGDLVVVDINLTMADDAAYVLIEDKVAGGLEPVNEELDTSGHTATNVSASSCHVTHQEIYGDRVSFFSRQIRKGNCALRYLAQAKYSGQYVAMPAEAYPMYDLARWGRSASNRFEVK